MKAGCFHVLEQRFAVHHISPNSHLFVAAEPIADFPGRSFAIESIATMNKKELKQLLAGLTHANIAVRNFPLTVAQLRKKLKLKDGGNTYLATTDAQGRHLVLRTKKRVAPSDEEATNTSANQSLAMVLPAVGPEARFWISVTSSTGITAGFLVPFSSATLTCSL